VKPKLPTEKKQQVQFQSIASYATEPKHYYIKKLDYFIMAMVNKFRHQFLELMDNRDSLHKNAKDVDTYQFKAVYEELLCLVRTGLSQQPKPPQSCASLQEQLEDVKSYIMQRFHRQILSGSEPSMMDLEILTQIDSCSISLKTLNLEEELQDEELWIDAIQVFDKLSKAETPIDKMTVL